MTQVLRTAAVSLVAVSAAAGCSAESSPVRAAVTWEGGVAPTGADHVDEDDPDAAELIEVEQPRVEAVLAYSRLINAAINSLNFSDAGLKAVATEDVIDGVYEETLDSIEAGSFELHAGPPEISPIQVVLDGDHRSYVYVCQRESTTWALESRYGESYPGQKPEPADEDEQNEDASIIETYVGDGIWARHHSQAFAVEYLMDLVDDRWIITEVNRGPSRGVQNAGDECELENSVVGVYTQQPDVVLLHDVTTDMVAGPVSDEG